MVWGLVAALLTAASAAGCAAASSSRAAAAPVATAAPSPTPAAARAAWLAMFARGYFPGRSGQIFVVPREGDFVTERDPLYRFMHGGPWAYDTHIPLLFHGAAFVRAGQWTDAVAQQDIAPTFGAIIGAPALPTYTGRILSQAIVSGAPRPRVAVLLVLDAMRADYFDRHAELMPTLTRLRREGAWFGNAHATSLPTLTSVGHATVGTGTDPRFHGLAANNLFNRVTGRSQPAYEGLDPRELMTLTLADSWNLATDGKAVIIGQGGAIRATAGLVGRGACLVNGRRVIAASYSTRDAGWETNPDCYGMSEALKSLNGRQVWEAAGGRWRGHDIASASRFRASSLFQRFEGDALVAVMEYEPIGADEITDLVFVNMKGPDYVAHAYGPDSAELRDTLAELDRQVARVLTVLDRKAGIGRSVVAITADHGMPGEPVAGRRRMYVDEIAAAIHERFDAKDKAVVTYYGDSANNQIFINTTRLQSLGFSLKDVGTMLEARGFFAAVFTEDDVRAAQAALPPR